MELDLTRVQRRAVENHILLPHCYDKSMNSSDVDTCATIARRALVLGLEAEVF